MTAVSATLTGGDEAGEVRVGWQVGTGLERAVDVCVVLPGAVSPVG